MYAFPPFCLMGKVLRKIEDEGAYGIIVFPLWPTQAWFSTVSRLLIDAPILLSSETEDIITHPRKTLKEHLPKLKLVAALIGNPTTENRMNNWGLLHARSSKLLGGMEPRSSIKLISNSGSPFVKNGDMIPLNVMKIE